MFKDGWLKWGFGHELLPYAPPLGFNLDYHGVYPDPRGRMAIDIAIEAAQRIYDEREGPLVLMVSGGVDSQAMAYAFKEAGVPFRAVMARFGGDLNSHEFETARFYRHNSIGVEIVDLDILDFHNRELTEWAVRYQNNSPHMLTHMKIASMLDGTIVSAGSAVRAEPTIGTLTYSTFGLERYARLSGQSMIGYFFQYDPCLTYALGTVPLPGIDDNYKAKVAAYKAGGFPVLAQRTKYHGFEKIKESYDHIKIGPRLRLRYKGYQSRRPYDLLFRYPLSDLVPYLSLGNTFLPSDFFGRNK